MCITEPFWLTHSDAQKLRQVMPIEHATHIAAYTSGAIDTLQLHTLLVYIFHVLLSVAQGFVHVCIIFSEIIIIAYRYQVLFKPQWSNV